MKNEASPPPSSKRRRLTAGKNSIRIEATGHKVLPVPTTDGKVSPEDVDKVVAFHDTEQMVLPRVVYISDTTEMGAVYTLAFFGDSFSEHDIKFCLAERRSYFVFHDFDSGTVSDHLSALL